VTLLVFILVAAEHEVMLFLIFSIYISSGPCYAVYRKLKKMTRSAAANHNRHHTTDRLQ
jgi:hypothetical protein